MNKQADKAMDGSIISSDQDNNYGAALKKAEASYKEIAEKFDN